MPYDENGNYTRKNGPTGWQDDRDADVNIFASLHDEDANDTAEALNETFLADGRKTAQGPFRMGGNKIQGAGDATVAQDLATAKQVQGGAFNYGVDISSIANEVKINLTPAMAAFTNSFMVSVKIANSNTGAATLQINTLAAKEVLYGEMPLLSNTLKAGGVYHFIYNNALDAFQLLISPQGGIDLTRLFTLFFSEGIIPGAGDNGLELQGTKCYRAKYMDAYDMLAGEYADATNAQEVIGDTTYSYKLNNDTKRRFYTLTDYNARYAATGDSGGFVVDTDGQYFYLPKTENFFRATTDADALGNYSDDTMRPITGEIISNRENSGTSEEGVWDNGGALYYGNGDPYRRGSGAKDQSGASRKIGIDSARLGDNFNGTETAPKHKRVFVYYHCGGQYAEQMSSAAIQAMQSAEQAQTSATSAAASAQEAKNAAQIAEEYGIEDAPADGKQYARQDNAWSEVEGGGGGAQSSEDLPYEANNAELMTHDVIERKMDKPVQEQPSFCLYNGKKVAGQYAFVDYKPASGSDAEVSPITATATNFTGAVPNNTDWSVNAPSGSEFSRIIGPNTSSLPRWQSATLPAVGVLNNTAGKQLRIDHFKLKIIGENNSFSDRMCSRFALYVGDDLTADNAATAGTMIFDSGSNYRTDIPATGAYVEILYEDLIAGARDTATGNSIAIVMLERRGGGSSYTTLGAQFQAYGAIWDESGPVPEKRPATITVQAGSGETTALNALEAGTDYSGAEINFDETSDPAALAAGGSPVAEFANGNIWWNADAGEVKHNFGGTEVIMYDGDGWHITNLQLPEGSVFNGYQGSTAAAFFNGIGVLAAVQPLEAYTGLHGDAGGMETSLISLTQPQTLEDDAREWVAARFDLYINIYGDIKMLPRRGIVYTNGSAPAPAEQGKVWVDTSQGAAGVIAREYSAGAWNILYETPIADIAFNNNGDITFRPVRQYTPPNAWLGNKNVITLDDNADSITLAPDNAYAIAPLNSIIRVNVDTVNLGESPQKTHQIELYLNNKSPITLDWMDLTGGVTEQVIPESGYARILLNWNWDSLMWNVKTEKYTRQDTGGIIMLFRLNGNYADAGPNGFQANLTDLSLFKEGGPALYPYYWERGNTYGPVLELPSAASEEQMTRLANIIAAIGTGGYKITFWIKRALEGSEARIGVNRFTAYSGGSSYSIHLLDLRYSSTSPKLYAVTLSGANMANTSPDPLNDYNWHYIELSRAGGQARLFVDGVQNGAARDEATDLSTEYGPGKHGVVVRLSAPMSSSGCAVCEIMFSAQDGHTQNYTPPELPVALEIAPGGYAFEE